MKKLLSLTAPSLLFLSLLQRPEYCFIPIIPLLLSLLRVKIPPFAVSVILLASIFSNSLLLSASALQFVLLIDGE